MSITPSMAAWKLSYQISPIVLTGGIAQNVPGGMMPITSITQSSDLPSGLLSNPTATLDLDDYFANFRPMPGGSLISQDVGHYPFANQATAANAVITKPLRVSMLMTCPAREGSGYQSKLSTMMALQSAIAQHNASGGTYTVATPFYIYTNCLLLDMQDVTPATSAQPQRDWQWDFEQPLLTQQQAQQALNSLMSKINGGLPTDGSWSGAAPTLNQPSSLATPSVVPSASNLSGAGVAGSSIVSSPLPPL